MQSHLRLHFETEEASDEAVLAAYPATIRCAWLLAVFCSVHGSQKLAGLPDIPQVLPP